MDLLINQEAEEVIINEPDLMKCLAALWSVHNQQPLFER